MAALTNGNTGGVGAGSRDAVGGAKPGKYTAVETLSLQDMVADATATQINDTIKRMRRPNRHRPTTRTTRRRLRRRHAGQ